MGCLYTILGLYSMLILWSIIKDRKAIWCFLFHRKYRKPTGKGRMDTFLGIMATPIAFYKCDKCGYEYEKDAGKSDVW